MGAPGCVIMELYFGLFGGHYGDGYVDELLQPKVIAFL